MSDQGIFTAEAVMAGLTDFQRNTVEHVIDRFYHGRTSSRFLVADETGLGKTIVARGVIARAIEELQRDDSVDRIDIVYVCSNTDLASQNLGKLNVTGESHHAMASRLTLLAKHSRHLRPAADGRFTKPVNLVSFTPGTSFEKGWRTGKVEERAMLFLLLEHAARLDGGSPRERAALQILQAGVRTTEGFKWSVDALRWELRGDLDETVKSAFLHAAGTRDDPSTLLGRFETLLNSVCAAGALPDGSWDEVRALIGDMRAVLARESVIVLEPDLIILDEFQRFRHLLDRNSEAGELAHHLFDHGVDVSAGDAGRPVPRTLLLSATPYKPFTFVEEGEDHHQDFMKVVRWLSEWGDGDPDRIAADLERYRRNAITGQSVAGVREELRESLLRVMVRNERPRSADLQMSREVIEPATGVSAESLLGFVGLKKLARAVGAPLSVEYWKSSPFFVNFMDGYKVGEQVRGALKDPDRAESIRSILAETRHLNTDRIDALQSLGAEQDNARFRILQDQTTGQGWWRLLWVPPTLPYLKPDGPYARGDPAASMTKRLVFSSWAATPAAIATLLSHEADRLAVGDAWEGKAADERDTDRKTRRSRLGYRMDSVNPDRPARMALLALFWPMPGVAALADPLAFRRGHTGPVDADELLQEVKARLREDGSRIGDRSDSHWAELFGRQDSLPGEVATSPLQSIVAALKGEADPDDATEDERETPDVLLSRHVELAMACRQGSKDRSPSEDSLTGMALVAAHSPANIAYRALRRVSQDQASVTISGVWTAAAHLASALRTLFARPETTLLLDQVAPDASYWRSVLRYCANGNLQAVLDEYIHHLVVAQGDPQLDDAALLGVAGSAGEAIALRTTRYEFFDPDHPESRPAVAAHFALRYGGRRQDQESARQPQVRQAFNSPFRPFVLATTSVGQEGIDFHWWCHSILHWNTPASPIDFEQREGRVDRYDGHAVRRNIAEHHAAAIFASADVDPWDAAYRIAAGDDTATFGSFAPHWVYPGHAKIQRHFVPYGLSVDIDRLARVKRDVALYRLTFGQPRQEDMLELLGQRYLVADRDSLDALRVDLSAPHQLIAEVTPAQQAEEANFRPPPL